MNEYKEEIIMKIDKEIKKLGGKQFPQYISEHNPVLSVCIGDYSTAKENWCVIGDNIDVNKGTPERSVIISIKGITIVIGETVLGKKNQLNKILRDFMSGGVQQLQRKVKQPAGEKRNARKK